jgi:hypothetical protein
VGKYVRAATMEISMEVPQKAKNRATLFFHFVILYYARVAWFPVFILML